MLKHQYLKSLFLAMLLIACDKSSTASVSGLSNGSETPAIPAKEAIDNSFEGFIDKFSTDSIFQIRRTKFPLKTRRYDLVNDKDSLVYMDRSNFEMMDFRRNTSNGQEAQWEQKIVIDKNNTSVTIEIRGIENGLMIDYLFEKINGAWMLIEIDDSST